MAKKSKQEIFDIIEGIVLDIFGNATIGGPYNLSNITMGSSLGQNDIGGDSLDVVETTMRFEDEFDVELPDEAIEKIVADGNFISDYVDLIEQTLD